MPDREQDLELYRQHRAAQSKYTYFLLAAAASGIALSVRATADATLHWSLIPVAAAVLSWGVSFFNGCRYLEYLQSITYANADMLRIQRGEHPVVGPEPWKVAAATEGVREAMNENMVASEKHYKRQFRYLVGGGALFVAWHVLEIVLRS